MNDTILDDFFHKKEQDYTALEASHQYLLKRAFIAWLISSLVWFIVSLLDPENSNDSVSLFLGIPILMISFPPIIAIFLTFPIAIIPYRTYTYSERFFRAYLFTLILLFAGITLVGFQYIKDFY